MAVTKGITIQFRGDEAPLKSAINKIRNEAKTLDKELGYVNKALKFDPTNIKLWEQKQIILNQEISDTIDRLAELKNAQNQLDAQGVDRNTAEYRELEREIIKANNQLKGFRKEAKSLNNIKLKALQEEFRQAGDKMISLGNNLRGLSMAAGAVDVALAGLAYKSGQAADELNTMSKITGISTQELQKYKSAADLLDVSVDTIAKSQTKMKRSMLSAQQGSDNMAQAFDTLGVSIVDTNGHLRDQDDVFSDTIAALGRLENETERDALSMQIFGRSATELNPLIEDNGETYKRVADIFRSNNLELVDQETLDKANEFNDSIDTIKATWGAALMTIGTQLAGYLAPAMEKIAEVAEKIAGWLSQLDPQVLAIIGVIAGVVAGIAPVLLIVGKLALAISSIMGLMSTLGLTIGGLLAAAAPIVAVIAAVIGAGVLLYKNWDTIKEYATIVKDWVVEKWTALKEGVINAVNTLKEKVLYYWTALKVGVEVIIMAIKNTVSTIWETIKSLTTNAFNSVKNTATSIWNGIKNAITNPIQTAVNFVKNAIDKIRGFFSGLKLQLPHIKLPHFRLSGSFSLMPPSVPKIGIDWYKNGGIFTSPTVFSGVGVGEAGAEAVLPLKKLWEEMDKRFSTEGVTINVYATPGMDVNRLAEEVQNRIVALNRQKARAF